MSLRSPLISREPMCASGEDEVDVMQNLHVQIFDADLVAGA
jgi:hypothetical protein